VSNQKSWKKMRIVRVSRRLLEYGLSWTHMVRFSEPSDSNSFDSPPKLLFFRDFHWESELKSDCCLYYQIRRDLVSPVTPHSVDLLPRLQFLWDFHQENKLKTAWLSSHQPNMEKFSDPSDSYSFDSPPRLWFFRDFYWESELKSAWMSSNWQNIERFSEPVTHTVSIHHQGYDFC